MTTYYESMFLLDPADAAHNWEGLKQHVTDLVTRCGGEILYTERWPDRKLAYDIKGRRKGTFLLLYFKAEGDAVKPLRRESHLSERVLRLLILKNDRALEEIERRKQALKKTTPVESNLAESGGAPAEAAVEEEFGEDEAVLTPVETGDHGEDDDGDEDEPDSEEEAEEPRSEAPVAETPAPESGEERPGDDDGERPPSMEAEEDAEEKPD